MNEKGSYGIHISSAQLLEWKELNVLRWIGIEAIKREYFERDNFVVWCSVKNPWLENKLSQEGNKPCVVFT